MANQTVVLGSASPRRSALLAQLGLPFEVAPIEIDEQLLITQGDVVASVQAIATAKFDSFPSAFDADVLITADTLVACGNAIMGKPESDVELVEMLQRMASSLITILTAVCVGSPGSPPVVHTVTTGVQLRALTADDITRYVDTGVGMDKAGGLALQSQAGAFIESVYGCWSNVLGLPICAVAAALQLPPGGDRNQRCSAVLCGAHG